MNKTNNSVFNSSAEISYLVHPQSHWFPPLVTMMIVRPCIIGQGGDNHHQGNRDYDHQNKGKKLHPRMTVCMSAYGKTNQQRSQIKTTMILLLIKCNQQLQFSWQQEDDNN